MFNIAQLHFQKEAALRNDVQAHSQYLIKNLDILKQLNSPTDDVVLEYLTRNFPELVPRHHEHARRLNKPIKVKKEEKTSCDACGGQLCQQRDTSLVCESCGLVAKQTALWQHNNALNLSYQNNTERLRAGVGYLRKNHLSNLLNSLTGNNGNKKAREHVVMVAEHAKKNYIQLNEITPEVVRKILKQLRKPELYDRSVFITMQLNKEYTPPVYTHVYKLKLVQQFALIERLFKKVCAKEQSSRRNFLSYTFVLAQLNRLNGREDLNQNIKMLKSFELKEKANSLWRALMQALRWPDLARRLSP